MHNLSIGAWWPFSVPPLLFVFRCLSPAPRLLIFRERPAVVSAEEDDDECTRSRRRFAALELGFSLGLDAVAADADRMFVFFVNDARCLIASISFFCAVLSAALRVSISTLKLLICFVWYD